MANRPLSLLRREGRALAAALGLLTRFPVRLGGEVGPALRGRALHWYPAAGLAIGLAMAAVAAVLPGGLLAAAIITVLWVGLSGALHLDGLADCADAWVGGLGDRARTLAILKDPACGPVGATAIALALLLKATALATLLTAPIPNLWWLALIPALARALLPLAFLTLPYVREAGMGAGLNAHACRPGIALALALVGAACAIALPLSLLGLWLLVAGGVFALWRRAMATRLGGFTGDGAGALVELTEVALLVASGMWLLDPGIPGPEISAP
ncbi:MAG TPA: adenosylcobinamide-GDP ribazoletransferase [Porticoccaceae bacterium]|nr:adenosylcobinamide-GDP ribazoletransferase [Porticoccaceae bacterium]